MRSEGTTTLVLMIQHEMRSGQLQAFIAAHGLEKRLKTRLKPDQNRRMGGNPDLGLARRATTRSTPDTAGNSERTNDDPASLHRGHNK